MERQNRVRCQGCQTRGIVYPDVNNTAVWSHLCYQRYGCISEGQMLLIVNETHNCKMKLFRTAAAFCFDGTFHVAITCFICNGEGWWKRRLMAAPKPCITPLDTTMCSLGERKGASFITNRRQSLHFTSRIFTYILEGLVPCDRWASTQRWSGHPCWVASQLILLTNNILFEPSLTYWTGQLCTSDSSISETNSQDVRWRLA